MRRTSAFPDLVTAMSDPRLFGPMFAGASWDNWRTILRAALGLPMTEAEIAFFRTVANREPPGKRVKELDIIAGRRSGKDSVTSAVACYAAATFKADGKVSFRYLGNGQVLVSLTTDDGEIGYITSAAGLVRSVGLATELMNQNPADVPEGTRRVLGPHPGRALIAPARH